jgi:hypothetical protein
MKQPSLKLKIYGLLIVYLLWRFGQSLLPLLESNIFANERKVTLNIVALIVDKNLYNGSLKNSIDRYTSNYIQQKISNSRAIIFPIDTSTIKARDITKMLENIYYEGIEKEPSTLKGIILIGDKVPLPVINDQGTIFPSILPYTDFDDPKYYRDPNTEFFIPNNVPKAQAEIWQSVINVGSQSEDYLAFFEKLKQYQSHPTDYIGTKIRYDDFIDQQWSFNQTNLSSYINKFTFSEDLAYHRYNPILIDLRNKAHNEKTQNLTESLANLTGVSWSYANQVSNVFSWLLANYNNNSWSSNNNITPTVFVDDSLKWFQKSYQDLYGVSSIARMRDNVLSAGRRDSSDIDNHGTKVEYYDQLYTKELGENRVPLLVELNKQLEDKITSIVKQKQYPLRIAIPVNGVIEKHTYTRLRSGIVVPQNDIDSFIGIFWPTNRYYKAGIYEAFYYGKNASTITGIDQTSIFIWTPNPIDNNISNLSLITGIDNSLSIGSSYGILSQLVEANRWYATDKTIIDNDLNQFNAGVCNNNISNFRDVYLGGNTPLNLTWSDGGLELINKRYDRGGISNWIIANFASLWNTSIFQAGSIFNIAWSKRVSNPQSRMFSNNLQWWFLQRVVYEDIEYHPWWLFTNRRRKVRKRVDICDSNQIDSEPLTAHDISTNTGLYQTWYFKELKMNWQTLVTSSVPCPNPTSGSLCFPYADKPAIPAWEYIQKQELNYKTIDSLSIHNAPNPSQINKLNTTTLDRPIDSIRYLSFKWIWWDWVKFEFPNLYNVSVYKTDPNNSWYLLLKTPTEIEQSIRSYLQDIVIKYNSSITNQITKQPTYFNSNTSLFTKLWNIDPLSTPARSYSLIDTNILNNSISNDIVTSIAQIIYTENSLLPRKRKTTSLQQELEQINTISNLTNKKKTIIENYITKQSVSTPITLPWYQEKWYELISLTSNWDDSINSSQEPERIRNVRNKKDEYETYQSQFSNTNYWSQEQDALKEACASKYWEPVPLINLSDMSFPWFDMFACWLKNIGTPKVTFDFKNAQWPVITDGSLKDFISNTIVNPIQEHYNITDTDTNNTEPTSEEKEIIDWININISPRSYLLDSTTPDSLQPQISIEQKNSNIWQLTILINSTWSNCIVINNKNLCSSTYIKPLTNEPLVLPIKLATKKSWYSDITIKVCTTSTCTKQVYKIQIVPWPVSQGEIIIPYQSILSATPIPIKVNAKDNNNNLIPFSLLPYTLSSNTGIFIWGKNSTNLSDFREIQELHWPKTNSIIESTLVLQDKDKNILASKNISFAPWKIKITWWDDYFSSINNKITYILPKKKSLVYINKDYTNINLLPKLILDLKNTINNSSIAWPVIIQSEEGMFDIYKVSSFWTSVLPNTGMQLTNSIIFNGEKEHIILKPKGKSVNDNLIISYPDGSSDKIPFQILASQEAAQIQVTPADITQDLLPNNTSIRVKLYAYDDRWNSVTVPTLIKSETFWSLSFSWVNTKTTLIPAGWTTIMTVQTQEQWWVWYIVSEVANTNNTVPWLWKTKVKESIIPTSNNINGLYLNIMWTSRWDTYTNTDNLIPKLFQQSDKLLASTTQLTDPNNLKSSILQIKDDWSTLWKQSNERLIIKRNGYVIAQNTNSLTELVLGQNNDFSRSNTLNESSVIYPQSSTISSIWSWSAWSTNSKKILTLIDRTSTYNPSKLSSIEDAIDSNKNIWWRSSQEHLTQFWQWKSIGESTMLNASEFLINYWDPLITRISSNDLLSWANLDDWPWQMIVNDPSRSIIKSLSIDINNDGLKDIVTVFSNWDIIRSKQYGWKQLFIDMWPLLKVFWTIKDVFWVNAQWDGFDDIMIQWEDDSLRIYTNKLGIFDVDGFPVCINSNNKQANSLKNIDQRFIEDMDQDTISDIILNQEWQVKIIYGGRIGNGYTYISQLHDSCDQNWQSRESNNIKTIETLATKLSDGPTIDGSLLHRKWLTEIPDSIDNSGNIVDTTTNNSDIANQINLALTWTNWPQFWQLPLQQITNQATSNLLRRSISPIDYLPIYETLNQSDIRYINTSQLTNQDQVRVYKKYQDINGGVLQKDDKVKVSVSILWLRNDAITYIDRIQWPWTVNMNNNWVISWWNAGTLPSTALYKSISPQWGFMFIVDNITLWSNNAVEFSYEVSYQWWSSTKIKISNRNNDQYPDISIYPLDGCAKFLRTFINNVSLIKNYRDYDKTFIDLEKKLSDYDTANQIASQNYISGMTNTIQNISTATGPNASTINNILNNAGSETMSFWNFFNNTLQEWGTSINLNLSSVNAVASEINNKVRDAVEKLCKGNAGWQSCGSGLPIPFNMAFLAPWDFNIMWCKPKISQISTLFPKDSWFPVFAFPATLTTPVWPIPLPFPFGWFQKWATDTYWYFWFPTDWGTYPSMIRIYMAPTTTQQMGMAICMWPQKVGEKIPVPFNALWWNCIVTKVNMPTGTCTNNDPNGSDSDLSDQDLMDLSEFWTCTQGKAIQTNSAWETLPQSPFTLVSYNNWSVGNPFPPGTYFGVINFEKTPIVLWEENTNEGIVLQWGKEIQPQVQWAKPKWLVACIIGDWMDRQTNYIINNFTNMQIWVYLPDLSQIWEGFENIWNNLNQMESNTGYLNNFINNFWTSWDGIASNIDTYSWKTIETIRNMTINKSSLKNLSDGINNPFDELAKLFEQTPLIRINTVDIPIQIPMIYAEDITKYESYLKTWIQRNNDILKDWQTLVQWTLGICGKDYNINSSITPQTNNNELLTKEKVKEMYQTLKTQKDIFIWKLEKVKVCESSNRAPTNSACISLMQSQGLNITNIKTVKESLSSQQKINNQCLGLLFDANGDLNVNFQNLFSIMESSNSLENNIRANIKTLDQYKRFPLQLYQWIHVVDRYLSEITTTVDGFLWSLTRWLNTNATRFEQYVDAIITISTALQTRQAILDLSVDWQKKCSTCTVDNYDAYACSLGFLCWQLKLPILRLPPFKIPNIYIDLSHIDIWMDINLPKFQFTSTSVPLVELPNLPQPPNISIDGDIAAADLQKISLLLEKLNIGIGAQIPLSVPTIPLLPFPPTLPELPSFIPNINIELPVLPPAPKLPKIAPEIETVIKAVSFFSELYCIVKWWIGLVWESNVKTKIEQLTQRTYEIPLFDNINLSKDMSYQQDKLEWFDFQIDAYVNFTMNFNGVYTMIKWLADSINDQTKKLTQWQWNAIQSLKKLNDNISNINNTTQQNININNPLGFIKDTSNSSINKEQSNITEVTNFLINDSRTPQTKKQELIWLRDRIDQKTKIIPQTQQLIAIQKEVDKSIQSYRISLLQTQEHIKNYDKFIDELQNNKDYSNITYSGKNNFSVKLLTGRQTIRLENNNLMKDYTNLQKTLLSHYKKGIAQVQNNSNKDVIIKIKKEIDYLENWLNLSEQLYTNNKSNIGWKLISLQNTYNSEHSLYYNNQAATCSTLGWTSSSKTIIWNTAVVNTYPLFWATAQLWWSNSIPTTNNTSTTNLYDFSEYKNKILLPFQTISGSQYINVMNSNYFTINNKWYSHIDINNDKEKDVLRRDSNHVWIKYGKQNNTQILPLHTTTTNKYVAPVWNSSTQRAEDTNNEWYLVINGLKLKLYSKDRSVKNLRVKAQDYDSFTIWWTNSIRQQEVWWYIVEINTIPDIYHLKWHNDIPTNLKSRYVVFLPEQVNIADTYLSIHNQLPTKSLQSLLTGTVIDIVYYKSSNNIINYSFTDIPRSWYYTRIASLKAEWEKQEPIYTLSSPWSHHIVAWQQIIADTQGPIPDVQLQRILTNTTTDNGLSPQWYVNTKYNINIKRDDPNGIVENWIEDNNWEIISQVSGNNNVISGLYFDKIITQIYHIGARDTNNNITKESINLTINVPTISLDDIIYENTPTYWINIISSVSQGIDEGIVKFERKRNNIWSLLTNNTIWNQWFTYPLLLNQTTITGWIYNQSKNLSFFDSNGKTIATMDKDNGNINITPEYNNRIKPQIDMTSNTPIITLYDIVSQRNIFTIKTKTKNIILSANSPYKIINLSGNQYGSFNGGTCIQWNNNNCIAIATPNNNIVIPDPYHTSLQWEYNYNNAITSIKLKSSFWEYIWSISFNAFIK